MNRWPHAHICTVMSLRAHPASVSPCLEQRANAYPNIRQAPLGALAAHARHASPAPPEMDWGAPAAADAAAAALAAGEGGASPAQNPTSPAARRMQALCGSAAPRLLQAALAVVLRDGGSREAMAALAELLARRAALFPGPCWREQVCGTTKK